MPYVPFDIGLASLAKKPPEHRPSMGMRVTQLLVSLNMIQNELSEIEAALEAIEQECT
jgi:hypothetical protein